MTLAFLDWIILAIVLLSLLLGIWRGLVYEVISVFGWVAAFIVAQLYAAAVGDNIPMQGASEPLRYALGFILVFIGTAFAAGMLAALARKLIQATGLRPVDRVLGGLFGILRGLLILLGASIVILTTPLKEGSWWKESAGAQVLSTVLKTARPLLPQSVGQYIPV